MDRTVVAIFDDVGTAQRALEELLNNGFDRNDISVVRTNQQTATSADTLTDDSIASGAATGAGVGAVLGGIAGLVVGLGALAIPGIGPIVAAGPLATTLAGAGIGAATGGVIGALTDAGIPETEAEYYAEGIRRGGTLLSVRASENQASRAIDILQRFSPVDITRRATEWRSSGWTGFDPNAAPYTGAQYSADRGVERGFDRTTGAMSRTFDDYDRDFRSNWETSYRLRGTDYARYRPAYQYGYTLATEKRYRGRPWNEIEMDARRDWERQHPGDKWEDFKDAVRHAWQRVKADVRDAVD
jgi:uncharacterized membrane protein